MNKKLAIKLFRQMRDYHAGQAAGYQFIVRKAHAEEQTTLRSSKAKLDARERAIEASRMCELHNSFCEVIERCVKECGWLKDGDKPVLVIKSYLNAIKPPPKSWPRAKR